MPQGTSIGNFEVEKLNFKLKLQNSKLKLREKVEIFLKTVILKFCIFSKFGAGLQSKSQSLYKKVSRKIRKSL